MAVLAVVLLAAGCTAGQASGDGTVAVGPVPVVGGPTAEQLARGHWVRIPAAPIRLCDGRAVWDGRDVLMVDPGYPPCRPAAALYDPADNRWTRIAAPPAGAGGSPVIAWGGGRLLLVSWQTGAAIAWDRASGRWLRLERLPARDAVSAAWTGREFLVISTRRLGPNKGTASAFGLRGDRWTRLPDLPRPGRGRVTEGVAVTYHGVVYALAEVDVWHLDPSDTYLSGYSELLRLTRTSWVRMPLPAGVPVSMPGLTQVSGALLVLGSACPGAMCTIWDGAAALLAPGVRTRVVPLRPRPGVPYPYNFAAGPGAIVVVYSDGLGRIVRVGAGPRPGRSLIYDIATGRWLNGPTAPETRADEASVPGLVWTPYGVISLSQEIVSNDVHGHPGGWLLRPLVRPRG